MCLLDTTEQAWYLIEALKIWRARVAELADAADLKSSGHFDRAGSSPATSTKSANYRYRGVEQLVACRAHNPEVVGSNPASATKVNTVT